MHSCSFVVDWSPRFYVIISPIGLAIALVVATNEASADTIRYVDRNGRAHRISVQQREAAPDPPAADPPNAPTPPGVLPTEPTSFSVPYFQHVRDAATQYSLPIELIAAVMRIESGGNPRAISSAGAMGLMQLMPVTADEMEVRDAFDPRQNILGGARYLRILVNTFDGSVALALAAYHAGASKVDKYGGIPPYPDTQKYVAEVIRLYRRYKEKLAEERAAAAGASGG